MAETTDKQEPEERLPPRKRLERAAGRLGMRLIVGPIRAMPWPVAQAFGRGLGTLLFHALGRYRRVALKNLGLIYGAEKSPVECHRMAHDVFRHFGQASVEFVKLPQLNKAQVNQMCTVQGADRLEACLAMERGVILITGHFGNWEFLARWLNVNGYPLHVVARKANDPEADRLLRDTREGSGSRVHARGNSARAVLQCLREKQIIGILPDQNAADVFVPFLGVPTGTVDGPAVIHLRTQAPIIFAWAIRTPDNRYELLFDGPHVFAPTEDRRADIAHVMTIINARLEEQIRCHPTQWLWLHDRWKASPGVFADSDEQARILNMPSNEYKRYLDQKR